jgi:hypothetical protein
VSPPHGRGDSGFASRESQLGCSGASFLRLAAQGVQATPGKPGRRVKEGHPRHEEVLELLAQAPGLSAFRLKLQHQQIAKWV